MVSWKEKCGRRPCLRIDSVPKLNNEIAEDVFKFVKGLTEEVSDLEIPEAEFFRARRTIGNRAQAKLELTKQRNDI